MYNVRVQERVYKLYIYFVIKLGFYYLIYEQGSSVMMRIDE